MTEISRRHLIPVVLALIVGVVAVRHPIAIVGLGVALALSAGLRARAVAALAFAAGLALAPPEPALILERQGFAGVVDLVSVPRLYPDRVVCEARSSVGVLALTLPPTESPSLGEAWEVQGTLKPIREHAEGYWRTRHVVATLQPRPGMARKVDDAWLPARWATAWRASFVEWCARSLSPEAAALTDALCFNLDTFLEPELKVALADSGTIHIVSASGLHATFVLAALLGGWAILFRRGVGPRVPRTVQLALALALLAFFALATGLRPPVVRAALMSGVFLTAYLVRREPDGLSALAFAALLTVLWQPASVYDLGFQLSYAIMAALVMFTDDFSASQAALQRVATSIGSTARQSFVASLASLPLLAIVFGRVSLVAVVSNVLIVFALPVIMVAALGGHLLSFIAEPVAFGLFRVVLEPLCQWILAVVRWTASWPAAAVDVPALEPLTALALYGCAVVAWRPRARPA